MLQRIRQHVDFTAGNGDTGGHFFGREISHKLSIPIRDRQISNTSKLFRIMRNQSALMRQRYSGN